MTKATLQDISDKTGLSVSTVSRILRGESKSSSENVELTIRTAQEINYPINTRILKGKYDYKKRLQVALVTAFEPDEFYSSFYHGFYTISKDENINLSLYTFEPNSRDLNDFIKELSFNAIDAAILFLPSLQEQDYLNLIKNCPTDFTLISVAPLFNPTLDTITFDSYRGGHLVARHFYEKGYHDVGIITGPSFKNESLLRKNGFSDFITQKHEMNLVFTSEGDYTFDSGKRAFEQYMSAEVKPRAIFSSNDYMCLGFLQQANRQGVSVPDELALASYDDLPICDYVHPSITSIHTDYEMLARKSYKVLKDKLQSSSQHHGMLSVIPVTLNERSSS